MPKFCANLSLLFTEHPLEQRFQAAADAGFDAVEIQFPYSLSAAELQQQLHSAKQQLVLINLPAGDWQAGERGIACLPERDQEFRDGVEQALAYAIATGCRQINCLAGIRPATLSADAALEIMAERCRYAAIKLDHQGIQLNIEAINSFDIPGFLINNSSLALELIERIGQDNVRLQYDLYHMHRMEGPVLERLAQLLPKIGHIQLADHPGRHEPGTGEIDYPALLAELDRLGYTGRVALEYNPKQSTLAGLDWLAPYRND
ncbi:hydroxypyruvate isomerase [Motiliproteus coralliicola]|uniref:Hydroxypyruvate isomerase n=1 Tax=Motiliproteus coralliicola TaxID=2283196 RepID=A0A369WRG6_9GAMM|nr:hydroxypyruvate isomerase [Motiliproteus coralliicola]RDE24708.1 hydroxypyruvate isomerase [Motiliproteus coralliicola]